MRRAVLVGLTLVLAVGFIAVTSVGNNPLQAAPQLGNQPPPKLVILSAIENVTGTLLDVTGLNFSPDGPVLVTLALNPLVIGSASDTGFTAVIDGIKHGTYLMTVTRGPGQGNLETFEVHLHGNREAPKCELECEELYEKAVAHCKDDDCLIQALTDRQDCREKCEIVKPPDCDRQQYQICEPEPCDKNNQFCEQELLNKLNK